MQLQHPPIDLRHIQDAAHNDLHTRDARLDTGDDLEVDVILLDLRIVQQHLVVAADDSERRAQFVRRHADEVGLGAIQAFQLLIGCLQVTRALAQLLHRLLQLTVDGSQVLVEQGVLNRHRRLAGKGDGERFFVLGVGIRMLAGEGEHADDVFLVDERHAQPGTSRRQIRHVMPVRALLHIGNQQRALGAAQLLKNVVLFDVDAHVERLRAGRKALFGHHNHLIAVFQHHRPTIVRYNIEQPGQNEVQDFFEIQ